MLRAAEDMSRMVEVCPAQKARCPHCLLTLVGRLTARPGYVLVCCTNRRNSQVCSRFSLLIPLSNERVRVIELSAEEAKQMRAEPRHTLTYWLQLFAITT